MKCTNCQREIPDNIKFCPHCGQPVQIIKPKRKGKKIVIALILVFAILASLIGYRLYNSHKSEEEEYYSLLDYPYLNGLTYCEDGVIYVDTDLSDDTKPYVLGIEDEELVDACAFSYLSTFNSYTTSVYYISGLRKNKTEVSGTLYRINTEDITDDVDENIKNSELIAEDVIQYFVTSGDDNGVMYQNIDEEMFLYSDNGNAYLMDGSDTAYAYCLYNTGSSHIILTLRKDKAGNSSGLYIGAGYDMYHYDSATDEFNLVDEDVSFPSGRNNKYVYKKHINGQDNRLDAYIAEITEDGIKTTKIAENIDNIEESVITDEITHITYTKEGDHPDEYTYNLFVYDNGNTTELGEVSYTRISTEYVTIYNNYDPSIDDFDNKQYYNTGSSEIYESPFTNIKDAEMAVDSGKILIEAYNEDMVSCVYLCDVEYGKELTNIQMVGYNSSISGSYYREYLFYVAGEKTTNIYIQVDDTYKMMVHDIPSDTTCSLRATPTINDISYFFITNILDFDDNSTIYDLYIREEDKSLRRLETMVENISTTGKGVVFTKNKALYYYGGDTDEIEKIADSTYYYEVSNVTDTYITLSTYTN